MRNFESLSPREPQDEPHVYGQAHDHKSLKALLGLGMLILAGFVFYEAGNRASGNTAQSPVAAQRIAHSYHR